MFVKYVTVGKKTIPVWILLVIGILTGVVIALTVFGTMQISYRIVPSTQAPSLNPNPISVNLGDIVSGSTGSRDFGKVGTMSLPTGHSITAEIDISSVQDDLALSIYTLTFMKQVQQIMWVISIFHYTQPVIL